MNRFLLPRACRWVRRLAPSAVAFASSVCSGTVSGDDDPRPWASDDSWLEVELEAVSSADLHWAGIIDIAVSRRGSVYVNDWSQPHVVVLDSLLMPLTTVGRRGQGPGEFDGKSNLQVLPGDSLLVFDAALGRMTVFSEERLDSGRVTPVVRAGLFGRLWRLPGPRRRHLAWSPQQFNASHSPEADQGRTDIFSMLDASAQAVELDSVLAVPSRDALVVRKPGFVSVGPHPYARRGFVEVLSGGFAYLHSGAFSVLERLGQDEAKVLREGAPYTWPPVVGMVADNRDRIWVGLRGQSDEADWEWAAFTPDGRHVGSVRLPAGFRVMTAGNDKLFGVAANEIDVPTIRVYRINGGENG